VVDQTNGTHHHNFYDAVRDLSVVSVKAPKKISLSAKKPTVTKAIRVTIANPGEVAERIETTTPEQLQQDLTDLLGLETHSPSCPDPTVAVLVPKYAQPPYDAVIGVAPFGGRLSLDVNVMWACPGLASGATAEFTTSVSVDMEKIGIDELPENQANNVCPRPPAGDDPGCGAKTATGALGGPIVTRVTQK
jgi:hypothetical protein